MRTHSTWYGRSGDVGVLCNASNRAADALSGVEELEDADADASADPDEDADEVAALGEGPGDAALDDGPGDAALGEEGAAFEVARSAKGRGSPRPCMDAAESASDEDEIVEAPIPALIPALVDGAAEALVEGSEPTFEAAAFNGSERVDAAALVLCKLASSARECADRRASPVTDAPAGRGAVQRSAAVARPPHVRRTADMWGISPGMRMCMSPGAARRVDAEATAQARRPGAAPRGQRMDIQRAGAGGGRPRRGSGPRACL